MSRTQIYATVARVTRAVLHSEGVALCGIDSALKCGVPRRPLVALVEHDRTA